MENQQLHLFGMLIDVKDSDYMREWSNPLAFASDQTPCYFSSKQALRLREQLQRYSSEWRFPTFNDIKNVWEVFNEIFGDDEIFSKNMLKRFREFTGFSNDGMVIDKTLMYEGIDCYIWGVNDDNHLVMLDPKLRREIHTDQLGFFKLPIYLTKKSMFLPIDK